MPYGATIQISPSVTITIETPGGAHPDDAQKNIIEAAAFWQNIPTICGMPGCGATLQFFTRHPQNYHYYGVKCTGPKTHELNFSERKDHTSLYIKDDGWRDAGGSGQQADEPASAPNQPAQTASTTGDGKVDAGTVRMIQAVANGKSPKPDVDGVAKQFFGDNLANLTKENAMAVLDYLKSL